MISILQTSTFIRQIKKLHKNQKNDLDKAIRKIAKDPLMGVMKKGDLNGVRIYKFKMTKQLTLLAYEFYEGEMQLLMIALGSHENFYRNLKK